MILTIDEEVEFLDIIVETEDGACEQESLGNVHGSATSNCLYVEHLNECETYRRYDEYDCTNVLHYL